MYIQNQQTRECYFTVQTPKTKAGNRVVPMLDNLSFSLKLQRKEQKKEIELLGEKWKPMDGEGLGNLVFTTAFGKPLTERSINRTITSIVNDYNEVEAKKSKEQKRGPVLIEDFSPHTLRHTFATRCFENGIPPKVVQEFLGHTSLNMTMDLYTHVMPETKSEEIKKLYVLFKTM